ncbi:MAG: prepilin-type N-terminal cleavage/methylation domain-containing protein [Bdellovibrionaceae bacterium]|nr:prepilin-type N-terminal cleavage/methylation domain-containing protein [Pseudobdellovibrionaceae bacterium]
MFKRHRQGGFSLVELMVVVAIIGILATIAIPRVNKFIAKARQSEAQVNLSSLYTFNKNFYVEFQGYSSSFDAIGYIPEGNLRYNIGWADSTGNCNAQYNNLKPGTCGTMSSTNTACASSGGRCRVLPGASNAAPAGIVSAACPASGGNIGAGSACLAGDFSLFSAAARSQLVSGNNEDTWAINQDKSLVNNSDGTMVAP